MSEPAPETFDRDYRGVVEIRIHGVSGTPPNELLNRPIVRRVAGDQSAGFYRPAIDGQMRDHPENSTPDRGPWLEAFSWSGLTSGSASRAFWILLLPFGLINTARFAVPAPAKPNKQGEQGKASRVWATADWFIEVSCRLLAATLTAALVLASCGVGMLTIGARCGDRSAPNQCHGIPTWITDRLTDMGSEWSWIVGMLVPMSVVVLLMLISRRSDHGEALPDQTRNKRRSRSERRSAPPVEPDQYSTFPLAREGVWQSGRYALHQRGVHARVALTVTGVVASWPLTEGHWLRTLLLLTALAATTCDLVLLVWGRSAFDEWDSDPAGTTAPNDSASIPQSSRLRFRSPGLLIHFLGWAAVIGIGLVTTLAVLVGSSLPSADSLVIWYDNWVLWGFRGQLALLVILFGAVAIARWTSVRPQRLFIRGWSCLIIAAAAVLSGAAMSAAVMIAVPAWLAAPGLAIGPSTLGQTMARRASWFGPSVGTSGFAVVAVVAVVLTVIIGCLVLVTIAVWTPNSAGSRIDREHVCEAYGDQQHWDCSGLRRPSNSDPTSAPDVGPVSQVRGIRHARPWDKDTPQVRDRAVKVSKIFWWARRTDYIPATIGLVAGLCALVLAAVLVTDPMRPELFQWKSVSTSSGAYLRPSEVTAAIAWGIWFAVFGLACLVGLSILASRDSSLRRHIGIIWDIASFWPRDTHPLAPPCYNERAIPQLVCRIKWYVDDDSARPAEHRDPGGRVILAGHSQGSVIGVAALMSLPKETRRRVALLTYGSVLSRLYSRFFPYYFGVAELQKVANELRNKSSLPSDGSQSGDSIDQARPKSTVRWRNLFRYSDFLGGRIALKLRADERWERKNQQSSAPASSPDGSDILVGIDVPNEDPLFLAAPGDSIYPEAGRHSRFESDGAFQEEIGELVRMFGNEYLEYDPGSTSPDGEERRAAREADRTRHTASHGR